MQIFTHLSARIKHWTTKVILGAFLAPMALVAIAPVFVAPANAAAVLSSTSMTIQSESWNIIGLKSNDPASTTGPNRFPVGAKVCNTSGATINPVISFSWEAGGTDNGTAIKLIGDASYSDYFISAGTCVYAYWTVEITRAAASFDKTRKYKISAVIPAVGATPSETVNTDPDTALKVEKLVSQNRNTVTSLTISNALASIGDTATVTMIGKTASPYGQLTAWPVLDFSLVRVESVEFTFTSGSTTPKTLDQFYADACNWVVATFSCAGSGDAGGDVTTKLVLKRIKTGALSMNSIIYDFSGSSFHYNSDYGTAGVIADASVGPAPASNVASNDSFFTDRNTQLTGVSVGTNDSPVTTAYYETTTTTTNGTLTLNSTTGEITYQPNLNFSGVDTFTYKLCTAPSPGTACVTAMVRIAVGIQAINDQFDTPYQTNLTGQSVQSNDFYGSYVLGSTIFYDTSTPVNYGSLTTFTTSSGTFTYSPPSGFSGVVTFNYVMCRLTAGASCATGTVAETSTATVTINVGPLAVNDRFITAFGTAITNNVYSNDKYPASGSTFTLNTPVGANGTVTLNNDGTFTFTPTFGFSGEATFTYDLCDSVGQCSTATATITVIDPPLSVPVFIPVDPIITWPTPAPIYYPTLLSGQQLNAVAKYNGVQVPGTYTYQYPLGTKFNVGRVPMLVTFTPSDRSAYNVVSTTVIQVVLQLTPTITWPEPGPRLGPYTLDPTVLNAICSVPGRLTYDPALGTVLQPGTYTLKVTCTPTDPNYGPITTTVTLKVVPPTNIQIPTEIIPGEVKTDLNIPASIEKLSPVIDSVCTGLTGAVLAGGKISYTPAPGFSGNTCINVKVLIDGILQKVRIPVIVTPIAPDAYKEPVTFLKGLITWAKSPNATSYRVEIRGKVICTTTALSCDAPQTVGPTTPVKVIALGNDNTSTTVDAKYRAKKVLAFKVYFDTAKFNLNEVAIAELLKVARIMKAEGFTNIEIDGHTDSANFNNKKLSDNRARVTAAYLKKLLPGLKIVQAANADELPAASNSTVTGKAKNRRSEGVVY